jgi:hypothetical protein
MIGINDHWQDNHDDVIAEDELKSSLLAILP